jgi:hypothetical protein
MWCMLLIGSVGKVRHDVLFIRDWTGRITFEEVSHILRHWSRSVLICIKKLLLHDRSYLVPVFWRSRVNV